MTKAQLIEAVTAQTGREKPQVEAVVESITIAAKRDASFKASKELSERLIRPETEASPT